VEVTVQLVGEEGNVGATADHRLEAPLPETDAYQLMVDAGALPGAYDLEVIVADPLTDGPLSLLGADGQPRGDRARLTKVRVYP
jgi:hypothetical protein